MAQPQAVAESAETSQDSSQQTNGEGKQEREQSKILFPYQDLDEGIEIAKAIYELHGTSCQFDQIAAHLRQSPTSSSLRLKVTTAKTFGLVTPSQGTVTLTPLGSRICDTQQEKAARVEAFLTVPLYNAVYEKFKGVPLPPTAGLEAALVSLGVAQKQKDRARQVLQRSAQEAGFFQFGSDRLVMPAIKASAPAAAPVIIEEPEQPEKKKKKEEDDDRRHPLIEGLLKELPEPQTEWTTEDRKKWLEMASTIFNVIYKDSDDSRGSLKVVVERNSAKS